MSDRIGELSQPFLRHSRSLWTTLDAVPGDVIRVVESCEAVLVRGRFKNGAYDVRRGVGRAKSTTARAGSMTYLIAQAVAVEPDAS